MAISHLYISLFCFIVMLHYFCYKAEENLPVLSAPLGMITSANFLVYNQSINCIYNKFLEFYLRENRILQKQVLQNSCIDSKLDPNLFLVHLYHVALKYSYHIRQKKYNLQFIPLRAKRVSESVSTNNFI